MNVAVILIHVIMIFCKTTGYRPETITFCCHHNALIALNPIEAIWEKLRFDDLTAEATVGSKCFRGVISRP